MTTRTDAGFEPARPRRQGPLVLGVLGLVVLGMSLGLGLPASGQEEAYVPSLAELREFSRRLVRSEEVLTYPFHVKVEGGVVTFDAGDVQACSQSGALCSTPLGVLVRAQCRVELLRLYVESEVKAGRTGVRDFWATTVTESEKVINGGLESLKGRPHTVEVLLRRAVMTLWRVEEVLLTKLWTWADETGATLQTLKEAGGDVGEPCPPPPLPAVKLESIPPDGTIRYVAAIDWDLALLRKSEPKRVMTAVLGGEVRVPVGFYVVMGEWPDGTSLPPRRVELAKDLVLEKPAK